MASRVRSRWFLPLNARSPDRPNRRSINKLARKSKIVLHQTNCDKCSSANSSAPPLEVPEIWKQLQQSQQLCDGLIICDDGHTIKIHRIILAGISPYFRALFTNSINRGQKEIHVANAHTTKEVVEVILAYAYTRTCSVNHGNVLDVFVYSNQFEIPGVMQLCCEFFKRHLSVKNCLNILKIGKKYCCKYLVQNSNIFVLQNFTDIIVHNCEFRNLSITQLKDIFLDDFLNISSESIIFDAMKTWVYCDTSGRQKYVYDLLKCIRLGYMDTPSILKMSTWEYVSCNNKCRTYLDDVLLKSSADLYLNRPRVPYDIVFAIGGWSTGRPTNFMETYDNRAEKWLVSQDSDLMARAYHGLCCHDNKIYLIGGFDGNEYFSSVRCFDPVTHTWSCCAYMLYSRCYVSVVICMKKIYAIGGYNGRVRMHCAERYDIAKNQWEMIRAMHEPRSDASATVHNNKIYIAGGFNGHEVLNSVEMYDPLTDQWTFVTAMNTGRSGFTLISFHGDLYAIGGFSGYSRLTNVEKFTPGSFASWRDVAGMTRPRSNFGTVILSDRIYVLGGFDGQTTIDSVEYFEDESNWCSATSMHLNRSALGACVLSGLPNSKDYSYLDNKNQKDEEKLDIYTCL